MSASSTVEMYVPIHLPGMLVRDAMLDVMQRIRDGIAPYDALSLAVELKDLKIQTTGALTVPIHAEVETHPQRWECALKISAAHEAKFFPTFQGTLTVTPSERDASELWLQGSYETPMGTAGAALNAMLLHGAAEPSLRTFLDWLAKELRNNALQHERESSLRARGRFTGG